MFAKEKKGCYYIEEFKKFGVNAVYTSGEFDKKNKIKVHGVQTHSKNVKVIDGNLKLEELPFPDTDGLITNRKDVVLWTKHADCLAIYFYDEVLKVFGLCHAGWRGTFQEIGLEMLNKMQEVYGCKLENILVGIGIGISQKNYEVSQEFYEDFIKKFGKEIPEKTFIKKSDKYLFDNELFTKLIMQKYGVKSENIIISELCTYDDENLHSYRRGKLSTERNGAYIEVSL